MLVHYPRLSTTLDNGDKGTILFMIKKIKVSPTVIQVNLQF